VKLKKINVVLLFLIAGLAQIVFAQRETIQIKVDTIITHRTKIVKIATFRTVPKFILHFDAHYNSGALELSSHNGGFSRFDFLYGKSFGVRHGFGASLIGKIPLGKKGNFWLDIISGYDRFQSDLIADNSEEGKASYNSFNGGVGVEYNFTPTHKVKYFVGLNPLFSVISGDATIINPDNNRIDISIKSSFRLGYSAFVGLEYAFEQDFGINLGLKFTHANLLFKNSEEVIDEASGNSTISLNDDVIPPESLIQFAGWKQFAYFTGSVGVSYFFSVKKVKYRLPD
jgi:hypothetical protein